MERGKFQMAGSALGFAGGILYAVYGKKSFWSGFGLSILGSLAGGGVGYAIDTLVKKQDKP